MLLAEFIKSAVEKLKALYPEKEAKSIVLMLCEEMLGTKSYTHIVEPKTEVPGAKEEALKAAMTRLEAGEPIQYVLGEAEFFGRHFRVSPDVLIPRPETELLCREAIRIAEMMLRVRSAYGKKSIRILDLCTGSGCIAWTMSLSVKGSEVVGVDISEGALEVASSQKFPETGKNVQAPTFVRGDVLDTDRFPELGKFDLVISNPPYIKESEKEDMRTNVLKYEPELALFVPDNDPLIFYRKIAIIVKRLLNPEGVGLVEINESLGPETQKVFKEYGFSKSDLVKDFNDRNRIVIFR